MQKAFDVFAPTFRIVFFAGDIDIQSDLIGLQERPIRVGKEVEELWERLAWGVFGVLAVDIYLKYRRVRDPKEFVKKHWLDVAMLR